MQQREAVTQHIMAPTLELWNGPIVLEQLFDRVAVTKPKEMNAP
jgi:hypothetical protein